MTHWQIVLGKAPEHCQLPPTQGETDGDCVQLTEGDAVTLGVSLVEAVKEGETLEEAKTEGETLGESRMDGDMLEVGVAVPAGGGGLA